MLTLELDKHLWPPFSAPSPQTRLFTTLLLLLNTATATLGGTIVTRNLQLVHLPFLR